MKTTIIRTEWVWSNQQIIAAVRETGRPAVRVFRSTGLHCHVTLAGGKQLHLVDGQRLAHVEK